MLERPRYTQCQACGEELPTAKQRRFAATCNQDCYRALLGKGKTLRGAYPELPSGTVGAISELRAATDLMRRGYHVFRAISPTSPSDLAILKDGQLILIEVRTAYWNRARTSRTYPKALMRSDAFALVIGDEPVHYEPPLETFIKSDVEAHLENRPRLL